MGLGAEEVASLTAQGLVNGGHNVKTKSVGRIVRDNTCTLFNLINVVLAVFVAITGSYKNMLFMGVIICNVAIGIFQELRAKKTIDRLSLLSAPHAKVIRDGEQTEIAMADIVPGDLCVLERGDQICADAVVISGECEVDESLLTGESDPVYKKEGDELLSGSFLVGGRVKAKTEHVGEDNYAYKIVSAAKHIPKPNSEMMRAINKIILIVSICIIPIAGILFYKQCFIIGDDINMSIISTVAAIIAMIPEGLVLLVSAVLAVSVVRLSKERTLVQELYCIETLARVNVLCLDKTGTITEGSMNVRELVSLSDVSEDELAKILSELTCATGDSNPTALAIKEAFGEGGEWKAVSAAPFSSEKKMSGADFGEKGSYVLGAAEFVLKDEAEDAAGQTSVKAVSERAASFAEEGLRVLVLAKKEGERIIPLCLVLIEDVIRGDAKDTLEFFDRQGVKLKVISGDSRVTVASVAKRAGIEGLSSVDMTTLGTDDEVREAAGKYDIFGRVTPAQKLTLVKALKENGSIVAMTGDGVNDVLALREADCSIAMQSGSDAARNVSKLVLLDSNFSALPKVVAEGRRSINNLERSASLFLEKTTYAFLLALIFVFLNEPYPFKPIQLTLVSALTIGIPSFLLALEPNYDLVRGRFFANVMRRALPGGLLIVFSVMASIVVGHLTCLDTAQVSTLCVMMTAAVAFVVLFRVCIPWNKFRALMFIVLVAGFVTALLAFKDFFFFTEVNLTMFLAALVNTVLCALLIIPLSRLANKVFKH